VVEVDGRRQQAAVEGQHARGGFDRSRGPKQVTVNRLRRAHSELTGVVAEHRLDGFRLSDVTELGRRAVRVDVADLLEVDTARLERVTHGAHRALALRLRRREVVHIGARAVTGDL